MTDTQLSQTLPNNSPSMEESRKNKMLLAIFIVAVIGFITLIYFRPQLSNPHVFDNMSFPPTPHDLYNLSKVRKFLTFRF
jgi:hypothetical protein